MNELRRLEFSAVFLFVKNCENISLNKVVFFDVLCYNEPDNNSKEGRGLMNINKVMFGWVRLEFLKFSHALARAFGATWTNYWPPYHSFSFALIKNRAIGFALFLPGLYLYTSFYVFATAALFLACDVIILYGQYVHWGSSMKDIKPITDFNRDLIKNWEDGHPYRQVFLHNCRQGKDVRKLNNIFGICHIIIFFLTIAYFVSNGPLSNIANMVYSITKGVL